MHSVTPVQLQLRKTIDKHITAVLAVFGILLLLLFLSPYLVPTGQLQDLSGAVLTIDNQDQFAGLNPLAWTVYSFGDLNCHQLKDRSFFLNGNQMPMCSRDTGMFIGLFAGALAISFASLSMRKRWLLIGLLPMIIDGGLQATSGYTSDNVVRVVTGAIAGAAVAMFICLLVAMPVDGQEMERDQPTSSEGQRQ
jgi:uncharacterized membrane protein